MSKSLFNDFFCMFDHIFVINPMFYVKWIFRICFNILYTLRVNDIFSFHREMLANKAKLGSCSKKLYY